MQETVHITNIEQHPDNPKLIRWVCLCGASQGLFLTRRERVDQKALIHREACELYPELFEAGRQDVCQHTGRLVGWGIPPWIGSQHGENGRIAYAAGRQAEQQRVYARLAESAVMPRA